MKVWNIAEEGEEWRVLGQTERTQAAYMEVRQGDSEGGSENKHETDQWLFVLNGSGTAEVEGKKVTLRKGTLLLIQAGERHEIKASNRSVLKTINFYGARIWEA